MFVTNILRINSAGLKIAGLFGGTAFGILGVCVPFIAVTKKGASLPFIPATEWQMKNIEHGITRHVTDRSNFIDIGSGDGRITLLGADYFEKSQGIEINRWLVYYSALKALRSGKRNTKFFRADLWKHDFNQYSTICIFGVQEMMDNLELKLFDELSPGSIIICCRFPFPNRKASSVIGGGIDTVWIYRVGASSNGAKIGRAHV